MYQGDTFFNQRKNSHRTQKLQEQQQTRPIDSRDKAKEEADEVRVKSEPEAEF